MQLGRLGAGPIPGKVGRLTNRQTIPSSCVCSIVCKADRATVLAAEFAQSLSGLDSLPPIAMVLVVCGMMTLLTELTSNTATAAVMLPILAAGLLDGVNPCAFTTLVFLLSALALAGQGDQMPLVIDVEITVGPGRDLVQAARVVQRPVGDKIRLVHIGCLGLGHSIYLGKFP